MSNQRVKINSHDNQTFSGYLSLPQSGQGPAILMLQEIFGVNAHLQETCDQFAQEGYVVLAPDLFWRIEPGLELGYSDNEISKALEFYHSFDEKLALADSKSALTFLQALPQCTGKAAVIGSGMGGKLAYITAAQHHVDACVCYYGVGIETALDELQKIKCPTIMHFGEGDDLTPPQAVQQIYNKCAGLAHMRVYTYPGVGHGFTRNPTAAPQKVADMVAYERSLHLLRDTIGPHYDLSKLWDRHCELEFVEHDAQATMRTMTDNPYVNHVPTLTGGAGQKDLFEFYRDHFTAKLPSDAHMIPISRTISANRVVDEFLFCFTHDAELDFMLPGVQPTGKYVEIPTVAVVGFRGDKITHEHIHWDQASVLVQLGLMQKDSLPVAGIDSARKLLDQSLPANALITRAPEAKRK